MAACYFQPHCIRSMQESKMFFCKICLCCMDTVTEFATISIYGIPYVRNDSHRAKHSLSLPVAQFGLLS